MSGEDRSKERIDKSGEVFTPDWLVDQMVAEIPESYVLDPTCIFNDSSCGDGQILSGIIIRMLLVDITLENALRRITGTDIMESNVELCRSRLICGNEDLRPIVEKNIRCADGLKYSFGTNESDPLVQQLFIFI
jgi:hypothetical protein